MEGVKSGAMWNQRTHRLCGEKVVVWEPAGVSPTQRLRARGISEAMLQALGAGMGGTEPVGRPHCGRLSSHLEIVTSPQSKRA